MLQKHIFLKSTDIDHLKNFEDIIHSSVFIKKLPFESKLITDLESALKSDSTYVYFECSTNLFLSKNSIRAPSGFSQNMNSIKMLFEQWRLASKLKFVKAFEVNISRLCF